MKTQLAKLSASDNAKPKKVKKLLEKDIQAQIVKYLEANRIHVAVTNAERVWGKFGGIRKSKVSPDHPDLTCVLPIVVSTLPIGLAWYIEVKTPTGSIREGQKVKLKSLADAGALCILARSIDDVMPIVTKFKDKELDYDLIKYYRKLLELNLSDRRSKEVRDALKELMLDGKEKD